MTLAELLSSDRVVVPLEVRDQTAAVEELCRRLEDLGALDEGSAESIARAVATGEGVERIRVDEALLLTAARTNGVGQLEGALGIAASPFRIDPGSEEGEPTMARALLLLLTPGRLSGLRVQAIPALLDFFRQHDRGRRLAPGRELEEILDSEVLAEVEVHDRLLVEDAMSPLEYRVYPDTPIEEVVDLMIRRSLHAVPVVGETHEVLGIVTSGDALKHLLPRRLSGEGEWKGKGRGKGSGACTRDVMTRSVLCVSEDQSLVEAANMMINKDVEQLPVVREGELVGVLTRDTLLRHLFGS